MAGWTSARGRCFRRLHFLESTQDYRAGLNRLVAFRLTVQQIARNKHWILVDDAADVIKWVLMWCGFHEWDIEPTGVRIKNPMVFHQSTKMIDIINYIKEQGDFVFHVGRPSDDLDSIGVPVFRRTKVFTPVQSGMEEVRDTDLLTGINTKFSKESLAWMILCRGKEASKKQGGVLTGEDPDRRLSARYFPPWSGAHRDVLTGKYDVNYPFAGRLAGLWKQVVHTDPNLETYNECLMACILIAAQESLSAFTGTITVPGYPGFELDEQVGITDQGSGVNTRMWIASHTSSFISGQETSWFSTLGGAMIDTPDNVALAIDYYTLLAGVLAESAL
jgi:hypothetical protein